ncbi:MAG: ATP-binding protein [Gammaproteobacteria bacterium]|nr:ATP-binding protein [Gammaproteobacteria bacterium]
MENIPLYQRLNIKLGVTFGALILIGALLGNAISVQMTEREFIKLVDQQFETTTGMVEGFFSTIGQMAQIWGNHFISDPKLLDAINEGNAFNITQQLMALQEGSTADVVMWLDSNGTVIYDSFDPANIGRSLMSWSIVRKAVTSGEIGSGIISELGNFIIFGSTPLIDDESIKGVILIGYSINDTLLKQIKRDTEIDITLVRRRAVMASTFNDLEQRLSTVPLSYIEYQMLLEEQGHLSRLTINGNIYLAEADRIESMNPSMEGSIMLTYPESNLDAIKDSLFNGFFVVALIGFLLTLFVALRFATGILSPLRQLLEFSEKARTSTDKTHTLNERFEITAKDEVGALAIHFNHMIDALERRNVELEHAINSAERANQAKAEFISNMSHELRTPLHAILSFSKLGANKLEPEHLEKLGSYFDNINISGERLHQLIEELLDVSRLDAGKIGIKKSEADLLQLTKDVIANHQKLIEQQNMSIKLTPLAGSMMAEFDPVRIGQVIDHLLSNAIEYGNEGQTINISITNTLLKDNSSPALLFSIEDHGIGIPESEINSVFEPFVQGSETKTGAGGTGLGLAISKGIIAEHGGEIWSNNLEDGGSAFHFTIPR